MINLIKKQLIQIIDNIDSGNSNISEREQIELIDLLQRINSDTLNKLEAAEYIGVSRATFENYIDKGLIPRGEKKRGETLHWNKRDLDNYLKNK